MSYECECKFHFFPISLVHVLYVYVCVYVSDAPITFTLHIFYHYKMDGLQPLSFLFNHLCETSMTHSRCLLQLKIHFTEIAYLAIKLQAYCIEYVVLFFQFIHIFCNTHEHISKWAWEVVIKFEKCRQFRILFTSANIYGVYIYMRCTLDVCESKTI